jgi:hypothetical protein
MVLPARREVSACMHACISSVDEKQKRASNILKSISNLDTCCVREDGSQLIVWHRTKLSAMLVK